MNPIALIIGVPLGLWLSNRVAAAPAIVARTEVSHAAATEKRFGAANWMRDEQEVFEARKEANGRRQRAEFRARNHKS